ncbi:MAG: glycoside hydrolase family 3 C-terminal domain-containing protein [Paracoccaceae bacterium]|nr:glycoside hydrolase family 3 C-terminal domain-containing protein [Paracoccaceae bacterium]
MTAPTDMTTHLDAVLSRMTLAEKVGQLNYPSGAGGGIAGVAEAVDVPTMIRRGMICGISAGDDLAARRELQRLAVEEGPNGIPLFFGKDCIQRYKTGGPIPLALSCTWDLDLIGRIAAMCAREARADGINLNWAPMLDICHDARWGRIAEGNGEFPYLGARIAEVVVRAYQGADGDMARPDRFMATLKHFMGYGLARAGRDYASVEASPATLARIMEPFRAGIAAGAGAVMVAFNTINDIPVTAHRTLLQDVLRKRLGFRGIIVTDFTAIDPELIHHGVAEDSRAAAYLAFKAGVNVDLVSQAFLNHLPGLVADGIENPAAYTGPDGTYRFGPVTEAEITDRARQVLEAKWRLGLFHDPYIGMDEALRERVTYTAANRALVREAAAKSLVLLKNDRDVLPLRPDRGRIAVIGPLADDRIDMQGTWAIDVDPTKSVTILEGLRAQAGERILHAKGCNIVDDPSLAARLNMHNRSMPSVIIGPDTPEAMLREALEVARSADAILLCLGEAKEHAGESSTRADIALPAAQRPLFDSLSAFARTSGKPLILIAMAGRPLALSHEVAGVDALIWAGHLGNEAGNAIAEVLFGRVAPSGRLSQALPRSVGQLPLRTEDLVTGRPIWGAGVELAEDTALDAKGRHWFRKFTTACILEEPMTPLFPAGFGLTYTSFRYGPLRATSTHLRGAGELTVTVEIANTGPRAGTEVAQAYLHDLVGQTARPRRQLVGFERITLAPGETGTVAFRLTPDDLRYPVGDSLTDLRHAWEPGEFELLIGANAEDVARLRFRWDRA